MDKWAACCPLIHSRNSVLYQPLKVTREVTEKTLRYPPNTPIQRPATWLEQARDQILVALDRAVNQGNILHCLTVVQRACAQADSEYAAWLVQVINRYDPVQRARFCDLPESAQVIADDELEWVLQRVRTILAAPPPPLTFEVTATLAWSPKIGSKRYADLAVMVRFPGPLEFMPQDLNHLFAPTAAFAPNIVVDFWPEVELYSLSITVFAS